MEQNISVSHPAPNHLFFFFLLLAVLSLHCCLWAFSNCDKWGLLFIVGCRLLISVASLLMEHGLQGSVAVAHRLSCPEECGIFPDQGSNPCPLCLQAELT